MGSSLLVSVTMAAHAFAAGPTWVLQAPVAPTLPTGSLVAAACPSTADCLAVGSALGAKGGTLPLAEHWTGKSWAIVATPVPTKTSADVLAGVACVSTTECWAVGTSQLSGGEGQGTVGMIDRWNGTTWSLVNSPDPPGESAGLSGVACASATSCVAVGAAADNSGFGFTLAEKWSGSSWSLLKTPNAKAVADAFVAVACKSTTACVAVGNLDNSASQIETLAATWNGTTWALTSPVNPGGEDAELNGVACTSTTACVAVGDAGAATPFGAGIIENWNGSAWKQVPAPGGTRSLAAVSCASATSCLATGSQALPGGAQGTLAEAFAGKTWAATTTANPSAGTLATLSGVSCASSATCAAVGSDFDLDGATVTLGESFVSAKGTIVTTGNIQGATQSAFTGVSCPASTDCEAVGSYDSLDLAELWNGKTWALQPTPAVAGEPGDQLHGVACFAAANCVAVGLKGDSQTYASLAELWNGKTWTLTNVPNPSGATVSLLSGVSCPTATTCVAAGSWQDQAGVLLGLAASWNGSAWKPVAPPVPAGSSEAQLTGVSCASATSCVAIGQWTNSSFDTEPLADEWSGSSWKLLSPPTVKGARSTFLNGIKCVGTTCLVVGFYDNSSFVQLPFAEKWTGSAWVLEPPANPAGSESPTFSAVTCTSATACVATGSYERTSGGFAFVTLVEAWNGATWTIETSASPAPNGPDNLNAVSCSGASACTAVGAGTTSVIAERLAG